MLTALIDADPIAHRAARTAPDGDASGRIACGIVRHLAGETRADRVLLCFSCARTAGFRRALWPAYKAKRSDPPPYLSTALAAMRAAFPSRCVPALEADDLLGIAATCPTVRGDVVIVADDHDLLQVPGRHYRPRDRQWVDVTQAEADRTFLAAVLTGCSGDGVPGLPGVGPVKARDLLADGATWEAVVAAYASKGLPEADAVLQARLVRVARWEDWDAAAGRVRAWEPSAGRLAIRGQVETNGVQDQAQVTTVDRRLTA
jgi:DNA polymerase-1